jgi:hypothetical protein
MKNRNFVKGLKASVVASVIFPAVAMAGPIVGLGYSDVGLSGHARAGVTLSASNLYSKDILASGAATFARGYYAVHAGIGQLIPAGGVVFEPYLSTGFMNLNYQQSMMGINTVSGSSYGYSYSYQVPYFYKRAASIQDFYGLAGVNMNIPLGQRVVLQFGGGYGHTLMSMSGASGAVYKGKAEIGFALTKRVSTNLHVNYLHVPGAILTNYGFGISYRFR